VFPVQGPGFDFADPRLPRWMADERLRAAPQAVRGAAGFAAGGGAPGSDGDHHRYGILWTTLGETPVLVDALAKLHAGLTGERPSFKNSEDAATSLAERLEGKNCLVVIDDGWDPVHLEPFLRGGAGCARLITSSLLQAATDGEAKRLRRMR